MRTNDCWLPGERGPMTNGRGPTVLCLSFQLKIQLDPAISEWPQREAEASAAQYAILGGGSQNCHPKLGYPICSLALARFQSKIGPREEEEETKKGGRKGAAFYRFVLTWFGGHGRL